MDSKKNNSKNETSSLLNVTVYHDDDNDESNTSTKTKQMWSGLKMAVKAGGDESKAFAMIGKAKAENARRATVRQQRRSIRDGSGGSSNSKGNE